MFPTRAHYNSSRSLRVTTLKESRPPSGQTLSVEKIEANLPEPLEEISAVPTAWYANVFNTSSQQDI